MSRTDAELAADLAQEAGRLLLAVRAEMGHDFPPALGDAGDVRANELLLRRLRSERPGDAVLSEEAHDDLARLRADRVWIIDPLDGTREFSTPRREDWAVHVALWRRLRDPSASPQAPTARRWRCGCCATGSTLSSSGSGRPGPKRWRWSAATPTPTSTPAANGSGTPPHRRVLLAEVNRRFGTPLPPEADVDDLSPLVTPVDAEFRVGTMGLGWDAEAQNVVVELLAVSDTAFDASVILDDSEEGPDAVRVFLSPESARQFAARSHRVISAGRPPCPLCDEPLDPEGHLCVRANGYRRGSLGESVEPDDSDDSDDLEP